jgi:hypothetical protein
MAKASSDSRRKCVVDVVNVTSDDQSIVAVWGSGCLCVVHVVVGMSQGVR